MYLISFPSSTYRWVVMRMLVQWRLVVNRVLQIQGDIYFNLVIRHCTPCLDQLLRSGQSELDQSINFLMTESINSLSAGSKPKPAAWPQILGISVNLALDIPETSSLLSSDQKY